MKTKAHNVYRLADGTRVPGVTTIVGVLDKPALVEWANRLGLAGVEVRRYVDDKADIGTLAHDMVICDLMGEKSDTADYSENQIKQATWAVQSFYRWLDSHKVKLLWAERPLVSEVHHFGGKPDIYAMVDDCLELIDLKTGSGIYPEHLTQVSGGYGILLRESNEPVERVRILNIPRTNNENWGELVVGDEQRELHEQLFLTCLNAYNLRKQIKGEVVYAKKHKEAV
jgi:hypothetical protein